MRHLLLLLVLAVAIPAHAQQRSLALDRFHADIRVHEDGRAEVSEMLDVEFRGSWNGIVRSISRRHETAAGRPERLHLRVLGVTDADGTPLRYEETRGRTRHEITIWVPDAHDAVRSVVIRYEVINALRFFDDATHREGGHDELYWNVTGNEWDFPIRGTSATIEMPAAAREVEAWAYTGHAGSQAQDAEVRSEGSRVEVRARDAFAPYEGLTVSIVTAPGAIDRTAATANAARAAADDGARLLGLQWYDLVDAMERYAFVLIAIGVVLLMVPKPRSRRRRRHRFRRAATMVQYGPPEAMTPAEAGTLLDGETKPHDVAATLVDLAVRGFLSIEERPGPARFGLWPRSEYVFHLRRPPADWSSLKRHEQVCLQATFETAQRRGLISVEAAAVAGRPASPFALDLPEPGSAVPAGSAAQPASAGVSAPPLSLTDPDEVLARVEMSSLKRSLPRHYQTLRGGITRELFADGLWPRETQEKRPVVFVMGMIGMFATVMTSMWLDQEGLLPVAPVWVIAAAVAVFVLALIGDRRRLPLTEKGQRTLDATLGFREFLTRVEKDRLHRVRADLESFERFLPYALAFGVERHWARAFAGLSSTPPEWYQDRTGRPFHASSLARGLGGLSSRTGSMVSSRSGGGSSGSGGGGRSGGGSGGGGGRGF
jgi:hypothetical protein